MLARKARLFLLLGLAAAGLGAQTLSLVTDDVYPRSTPDGRGFEDLILKEAFRRVGLDVRITPLPSERALINVNQGIDDGLFVKVAGVEAGYPNLVRVPEPVCDYEFAAFGRDPSLDITGYPSLAPLSIAFIRGWKNPEAATVGMKSVTRVKDDEALFEMLLHGRVDVIVYEALQGRVWIRNHGLKGIHRLGPPLAATEMYLYLNVRHGDLAPRLAAALKAMKADGTWRRIVDSVVGGL